MDPYTILKDEHLEIYDEFAKVKQETTDDSCTTFQLSKTETEVQEDVKCNPEMILLDEFTASSSTTHEEISSNSCKANLINNTKTHANLKNFCCQMCDYVSNFEENLNNHMKYHLATVRSNSACDNQVTNLKKHGKHLTFQDKINIKNLGKPTPDINISQVTNSKSRQFKREFRREIYEKQDWICGCAETNRLFCFPCLLFARKDADITWTKTGVNDLGHLTEKIKKHNDCESHINTQLDFKLLGKQEQDIRQQLDNSFRRNNEQHNEQVRKNKYVLSKIIDCIKFCGIFELALRGHDETIDSLNPGIFRGLINFSAELDIALKEHFEKAIIFKGTSKSVQNDLLDCMLEVLQDTIKSEISNAEFVSVIVDETSDISSIFQMAVVFRYVLPSGDLVERFWTFVNPSGHDAESLADCIRDILKNVLDKPEKLISQSYDGAHVMSGRSTGVQTLIQKDYIYAFYVHCYAHQLNLILAQATSQNQQVRIFFSNLSDIINFFSNSPQRVAVLDEIVSNRIPRASITRWNFKSKTVSTVFENRLSLIECMETIEATSKQATAINQAGAISRMLQDSTFVYWLTVFHRLMPHADLLYNQLQKTGANPVEIKQYIQNFEYCIQKEREGIESMDNKITAETHDLKKRKRGNADTCISKVVAAKEVCDTIVSHTKQRFSFVNHLSASNLFLSQNFPTFNKQFPINYLKATIESFPFLDGIRLKTELEIIFKRPVFRNLSGAVNLLKFLIENDLQNLFAATFKLLKVIVTIPMTSAEEERCLFTLKRIKTFLRSSMNQERLTALAMLSIEKKLMQNIVNFNDLVIEKFASKKDRRMDFTLKYFT